MAGAPKGGPRVLVHADESCLGNDSSKPSPGGNAALIEAPAGDSVARWDFYESSPQTTNNKMALAGAIATLEWIRRQWKRARVVYVSDSQYLVKGMSEWVAGWEARGWKRKSGVLENQELWKKLVQAAAAHEVEWRWIEGHAGHAKNEYADVLATSAAERQARSNGLVPSAFDTWLAQERARGRYADYDPDQELHERLKDGVPANTHFLNVLPDGAAAPPVDRIPLYEVYMRMAEELAKRSTCARLQVGTVVTDQVLENVLAIGYNGNARGLPNKCDSRSE